MTTGRMTDTVAIKNFIFGGNAHFTLVSERTGRRFTYRARTNAAGRLIFVDLLTGSDNDNDYSFAGTVRSADPYEFRYSDKSTIAPDAAGITAITWLFTRLRYERPITKGTQFWHDGHCARCGRRLTTPESIELGIGPVCAEKMGVGA